MGSYLETLWNLLYSPKDDKFFRISLRLWWSYRKSFFKNNMALYINIQYKYLQNIFIINTKNIESASYLEKVDFIIFYYHTVGTCYCKEYFTPIYTCIYCCTHYTDRANPSDIGTDRIQSTIQALPFLFRIRPELIGMKWITQILYMRLFPIRS